MGRFGISLSIYAPLGHPFRRFRFHFGTALLHFCVTGDPNPQNHVLGAPESASHMQIVVGALTPCTNLAAGNLNPLWAACARGMLEFEVWQCHLFCFIVYLFLFRRLPHGGNFGNAGSLGQGLFVCCVLALFLNLTASLYRA